MEPTSQVERIIVYTTSLSILKKSIKSILEDMGFKIKYEIGKKHKVMKAIKGSKWLGLLHFVPLTDSFPNLQRIGIEIEFLKKEKNIIVEIEFIPYQELFDKAEVAMVTEDLSEMLADLKAAKNTLLKFNTELAKKFKIKLLAE